MEGKMVAAVGGCAVLAGLAYVLQGRNKSEVNKNEHSGSIPGLVNLGNTCYLNSVLQALASVSAFVSWIIMRNEEMKKQNPQKLYKLTSELSTFIQILSRPCFDQESYDPTVIYKSLYSHGWVISLEQQDAHEIFQVLTSTLAEEQELMCQKSWNSVLADKPPTRCHDGIILRSGASASKIERKSWSPFVGLFANQLSCKVCSNKIPVKFDSFDTISLSLSSNFQFGSYSLHGLIKHFMCSEVLESYECPGCSVKDRENKSRRLLKQLSIGKPPQCLCFHINRTYWQDNGVPCKNNAFVKFSETVNIEPFLYSTSKFTRKTDQVSCLSNNSSTSTMEQPTMKTASSQTRLTLNAVYSLVAVIVHLGGVEKGHYVTYRKTQWQEGVRWDLVSDEMTRTVPVSHVLSSNAYMLFYERTAK